jgi:hypothetical protein
MLSDSLAGSWGLHPPVQPGDPLIHPDDLDALVELFAYGRVFHCVDDHDGWLTMRYRASTYRVRPERFRPVGPLRFGFGDRVQEREGARRVGSVVDISWHAKLGRPMYFIEVHGKRRSRRYFDDELMPHTAA